MNYNWNWSVFLTPVPSGETTYLGWLFTGLQWTVALSLSAWVIALVVGSIVGVLRTVPNRWLSGFAAVYVECFRNVPLLVQLFSWYFVLPELLPPALGNAYKQSDPLLQQFLAAMLCLGLFTAARVAEQVRAGIESLPRGQRNAGLAMGFTLAQVYRHVLLPMAFRIIVPPLTSEFLNIFKNSAVATTIGLIELSRQAQQLVDYTAQPYEAFIAVTLLYVCINVTVMFLMRRLEEKVRVPGFIGGK
ncbi:MULTISPECIES: amino acid ABC transporter permease [Azospira]|jgi:glutamate/aspartate transport system permease protein|uniref:Amine acid ABC transporter, permease protein, 3-TM region, His/Glu/Gln/Arg/opine family n=1 Tax=Azospira oryzae (strain ATCC BAA-33 / DSM 13638 / PS) TaxID=640081 RepID=G8QGG7_AZOOP|nr:MULTISPECIES: amino acid ABC transporter permease [Azospira]AEV25046.1 amine acid ABC transporter, permease protein, 3-TM region, His/Glu/Gln/Arg/opine family [Azospira oryzae PS]MBP7490103.1 amino acid ABC transporter permease [Azospira sp.]MDK9691414.1 amino acid ABC transporter permease [Azospira sp.]